MDADNAVAQTGDDTPARPHRPVRPPVELSVLTGKQRQVVELLLELTDEEVALLLGDAPEQIRRTSPLSAAVSTPPAGTPTTGHLTAGRPLRSPDDPAARQHAPGTRHRSADADRIFDLVADLAHLSDDQIEQRLRQTPQAIGYRIDQDLTDKRRSGAELRPAPRDPQADTAVVDLSAARYWWEAIDALATPAAADPWEAVGCYRRRHRRTTMTSSAAHQRRRHKQRPHPGPRHRWRPSSNTLATVAALITALRVDHCTARDVRLGRLPTLRPPRPDSTGDSGMAVNRHLAGWAGVLRDYAGGRCVMTAGFVVT